MEYTSPGEPDSYRQLADFIAVVAEEYSSASIDEATLQRWSDIMALMREVDDLADSGTVTTGDIMERLHDFNEFSGRYPSLAPTTNNEAIRSRLEATAARIFEAGHEVSDAQTVDKYMLHRQEEAHETANLFADSASDQVRSQEQFSGNFMPLLRQLGAAACFLDSAKDLPNDHKLGQAKLEPTAKNRLILLRASVELVPSPLPFIHRKRIVKELARSAAIHTQRHFVTGSAKA